MRIGVGRPPGRQHGVDHVLSAPRGSERESLDVSVEEAADAVETIIAEGPEPAMNQFNRRTPP